MEDSNNATRSPTRSDQDVSEQEDESSLSGSSDYYEYRSIRGVIVAMADRASERLDSATVYADSEQNPLLSRVGCEVLWDRLSHVAKTEVLEMIADSQAAQKEEEGEDGGATEHIGTDPTAEHVTGPRVMELLGRLPVDDAAEALITICHVWDDRNLRVVRALEDYLKDPEGHAEQGIASAEDALRCDVVDISEADVADYVCFRDRWADNDWQNVVEQLDSEELEWDKVIFSCRNIQRKFEKSPVKSRRT